MFKSTIYKIHKAIDDKIEGFEAVETLLSSFCFFLLTFEFILFLIAIITASVAHNNIKTLKYDSEVGIKILKTPSKVDPEVLVTCITNSSEKVRFLDTLLSDEIIYTGLYIGLQVILAAGWVYINSIKEFFKVRYYMVVRDSVSAVFSATSIVLTLVAVEKNSSVLNVMENTTRSQEYTNCPKEVTVVLDLVYYWKSTTLCLFVCLAGTAVKFVIDLDGLVVLRFNTPLLYDRFWLKIIKSQSETWCLDQTVTLLCSPTPVVSEKLLV